MIALISFAGKAQDTIRMDLGGTPVNGVVQGKDTILIAHLGEAVIQPHTNKPTNRDMRQYRKLVYNVKKVYPYAKLAGEKFAESECTYGQPENQKGTAGIHQAG